MTVADQRGISGYALGLCLLFVTAVIWTGTSFISESLVLGAIGDKAVNPLLLTLLGTSLFILYLPLIHLKLWWQQRSLDKAKGGVPEAVSGESESNALLGRSLPGVKQGRSSSSPYASRDIYVEAREQEAEARSAAMKATPLWFLAQLSFNASLLYTSVTSNTVLSSASSLFTFVLSVLLLGERYTFPKLACVAACMAGTVLVTVADGQAPAPQGDALLRVLGDTLTLISAALYAGYTVSLRKDLPGEESAQQVAFFFGWLGVYSCAMVGPLLLLAVVLGWVDVAGIPAKSYGIIFGEGVFDYALADYLWAQAVLLLGPTVAALGLSVQIPMATLIDLMLGSPSWLSSAQSILLTVSGVMLILAGFFGINISSSRTETSTADGQGAYGTSGGAGGGDGGGNCRRGLLGHPAQGQDDGFHHAEEGGLLGSPAQGSPQTHGSLQPESTSRSSPPAGQHQASSPPGQAQKVSPHTASSSGNGSSKAGAWLGFGLFAGPPDTGQAPLPPVTTLNFKLETKLQYTALPTSSQASEPGLHAGSSSNGRAGLAPAGPDIEAHGVTGASASGDYASGYVTLGGGGSQRSSLSSTGALQVSQPARSSPKHDRPLGSVGDSGKLQELQAAVSGWKERLRGKLKEIKMGRALQSAKKPGWVGYVKIGKVEQ